MRTFARDPEDRWTLLQGVFAYADSGNPGRPPGRSTKIPAGSVDCIISSPPYNKRVAYEDDPTNDNLHLSDYLDGIGRAAFECALLLNIDGHMFLQVGPNNQEPSMPHYILLEFLKRGFFLQNQFIWLKSATTPGPNGPHSWGHFTPSSSPHRSHNCWEYIFHLVLQPQKIHRNAIGVPYQDKSNLKRFTKGIDDGSSKPDVRCRGDVWAIPYETKVKTGHPCPFPVDLPRMCLRYAFGDQTGKLVMDPYAGSCSVLHAALEEGHCAIGIDRSEKYLAAGAERLKTVTEGLDNA